MTKENGLIAFALAVLKETRSDLGDIDGGWLQDVAEDCGLLIRVVANEPCDYTCRCVEYGEFPHDCLRYSDQIKAMIGGKMKLSICRCPKHGFYCISVDNEFFGVRITPSKCCGSWTMVQDWPLTSELCAQIIEEISAAKEQIETDKRMGRATAKG